MKKLILTDKAKVLMGVKTTAEDYQQYYYPLKDKWNNDVRGKDYTALNNAIWDFIQDDDVKALVKNDKAFDNCLNELNEAMDTFHKAIATVDRYFRPE